MNFGSPGCIFLSPVHLLYLDDSGSASNVNEQYLVLGGVSVFEAQSHWVTRKLDRLAEGIVPEDPSGVEFHASEIYARRKMPWKRMGPNGARGTIKAVLQVMASSFESSRAFACVVHKASYPDRDPMEIAFEDLLKRFDLYLGRLHDGGDTQRGLVILFLLDIDEERNLSNEYGTTGKSSLLSPGSCSF